MRSSPTCIEWPCTQTALSALAATFCTMTPRYTTGGPFRRGQVIARARNQRGRRRRQRDVASSMSAFRPTWSAKIGAQCPLSGSRPQPADDRQGRGAATIWPKATCALSSSPYEEGDTRLAYCWLPLSTRIGHSCVACQGNRSLASLSKASRKGVAVGARARLYRSRQAYGLAPPPPAENSRCARVRCSA